MNDIFDVLFGKVDAMGTSAVQNMYQALSNYLGPLFLAGLAVYVVWWGYEMLFGRAPMTAGAFVWKFGRVFLCYSMIVSWATYQPLIVTPLVQAPDAVATVVCEAAGGVRAGGSAIPSRRVPGVRFCEPGSAQPAAGDDDRAAAGVVFTE